MRFIKKSILSFLLATGALGAGAQVQVDVHVDSIQLLIGEQTDVELRVTMDAGKEARLPALQPGMEIIPNLEVVEVKHIDTTYLDEGRRMELSQKFTITAWDSALYCLPPFKVSVGEEVDSSKSLVIKVYTMDVDTTQLDRFFPARGVMSPPFDWADWENLLYASFLLVLLFIAAYILLDNARRGRPIVRIVRRKKKLPPHQVAIEEIERIKTARVWAEEDSKEYYTQLTDALRNYIRERYQFNAMEMTSAEIIEHLLEVDNPVGLEELRELFSTADLVKFAKYSTLVNENDANLMTALAYINNTKVEPDPNAKPEPEVIKETDKRRMNQVVGMRIVSMVLLMAAVGILCWVVWRAADILL